MALFGKNKNKKDLVTVEQMVIEICTRVHPEIRWAVDREADAVVGEAHQINLANLRGHYNNLEADRRRAWCEMTIPPLLTPSAHETVDRSTLRAVVRNRSMLEGVRLHALSEGATPTEIPHHVLTEDLCALLVIDEPTAMIAVNDQHLADWATSFEELWPIGVSNLRGLEQPAWSVADERILTAHGDDYVSARLLLPEFIDAANTIPGVSVRSPFVAIPSLRTSVTIVSLDDHDGIEMAIRSASAQLGEPSQISFWPVVVEPGVAMCRLTLEPDHAAYNSYRQLTRLDLEATYAGPTQQLQRLVGDDLTVAPVLIGIDPAGIVETYAVWGDGETLIPNVDAIVFEGAGRPRTTASFSDVHAHCQSLMEETDHYPARWRVRAMPDQALIDRFAR